MADLDITGRVTVDASQAEGAFDRVGARADQMSEAVAGAAGRAGRSIQSIGAGAAQSGEQLTRSQSRVRDEIDRTTNRLENLGKTASQRFEIKIAAQGLDPAQFAPYLTRLREVEAAQAALRNSGRQAAEGAEEAGGAFFKLADIAESAKGALLGLGAALIGVVFTNFIKGGIDAADAAGKLAASTGLAAKEVAGLQLAFDQGDVGDKLQSTLSKLAAEAQKGNGAFAAMGIAVTKSSGGLKSTRDLLAEVSDKFASYRDGAEKTALAQNLLGESGAALIPLFNGGSAALAEFDETAKALGLTLSDEVTQAANQFNDQLDLVTQRSQGLARQLASELLPVLATIADQLANTAKQGGNFSLVGKGLSFVLETITLIGSDVAFVFRTLARDATLVFNSAVKLATLDFSGIRSGFAAYKTETNDARKALDQFQAAIVTARAVASAGDLDEPFVKRAKAAALEAAEAAKKLAPQVAAVTAARGANRTAIVRQTDAMKALAAAEKEREKSLADTLKTIEQAQQLDQKTVASAIQAAVAAEEQLAQYGLLKSEVMELTLAQLENARESAALAGEDVANIQKRIEAQKRLIAATVGKDALEAADKTAKDALEASTKAAADATAEWQKTADSINSSLTDALLRGFESGKDFAKNLKDTLVNMFKTMILRPTISAILAPIAGGLSGAANAGGGGGGFSSIASLASNASSMVTIGGQVAAGTMSIANALGTLTANATGTGISGLLATNGAFGTAAAGTATGAGITAALASIGPVGWAAIAVAALGLGGAFSRKLKDSGVEGSFGGERGFEGENFQFFKGGMFRSDKTKTNPLAEEVRKTLADSFSAIQVQTGTFAESLGLNTKAIETYSRKIKFSTKGLSETQIIEKLQEELGLVSDEMARLVLGTSAYTKQNETSTATLARLSLSLIAANESFKVLGLSLYSATLAAGDMASDLADKFGGMDALTQASAAYFTTYYSAAEQAAKQSELMAAELARVGVALPSTRSEFRALVSGLDLTTESGRTAYAALLKIAPQFDETARAMEELARITAARLIATFTANGKLVPALRNFSGALATTTQAAVEFIGPVTTINRLLGDAASGTLVFGERVQAVSAALSPAQLAVAGLQTEVFALRTAASGTVVDIAGLSVALRDVDTKTFVATVTGVFELIGQRIKSTLSSIADERVSVREAAIRIMDPIGMTPAQIRAQIGASSVGLPGQQGIASAQATLANAGQALVPLQSRINAERGGLSQNQQNQAALSQSRSGEVAYLQRLTADLADLSNNRASSEKDRLMAANQSEQLRINAAISGIDAEIAQAARNITAHTTAIASTQSSLTVAQQQHTVATDVARQAQVAYISALQNYSVNASRAVTQLGRLREETVKYFESQQQLASLMTGTASALRSTVAAFRFEQLDPAAQLASLQDRYNTVYSMALSTTGDALAGYGDELNSLINPLLQKAEEAGIGGVAYSNLVNTILARAEATAGRLETFAPKNFQAESLGLLGQIDSTLIALEQGALTADQLIVKAIDAGKDSTRDGLQDVVSALTGTGTNSAIVQGLFRNVLGREADTSGLQTYTGMLDSGQLNVSSLKSVLMGSGEYAQIKAIRGYALGGMHAGGLRLVGENGPELEVTGPSRIFSAADTASMLRGGQDGGALVSELRAVRAELSAMRREAQALQTQTVVNTGKTARILDRFDGEGLPVRNAEGQKLATEAV